MGKILRCRDCGKVYRDVEELEDLRDNDSTCLVCNNTIEIADWDRLLASYEDDGDDVEDVDDDDWDDDDEDDEDDELEDDDDDVSDDDFEALDEDEDEDEDEED